MAETFSRRINIYIDSGQAQAAYDKLIAATDNHKKKLESTRAEQKKALDELQNGSEAARKNYKDLTDQVERQKKAIQDLKAKQLEAGNAVKSISEREQKNYDSVTSKLKEKQTALQLLQARQDKVSAAMLDGSEKAKVKYDELTGRINIQKAAVEELRKKQEEAFSKVKNVGAKQTKEYDAVTDKIVKQEQALQNLLKKQQQAQVATKAGTPEAKKRYDDLTATIVKQEAALNKLTDATDRQSKKISGVLSPSYKELDVTVRKLERELHSMAKEDTGFEKKRLEYNAAKAALDSYGSSLVTVKQGLINMLKEARGVAAGVLIGNTVQAVAQKITGAISGFFAGAAKVSDEFSNIEKTTNLTTDEVRALNAEISKEDTRTTNSKLRQYAVEAGKLGKEGVEDIKTFVQEANKIDVALGEDLGEDAIIKIAKVAGIFKEGALNIASGINEIGQSSAASEAYQVEFLSRMAGVSQTVDLGAKSILGYGAALDINGQEVEKSSTALQTFFIDFVKNTDKFGKAAGFASGELKKLLNEKGTNDAFIAFLEKLKEGSKSSEDLLRKLEALGIDGARGASTFLTLANNIGLVKEQQEIANQAIEEGTSITEEYEKRNNNLAGTYEKIGKELSKMTAASGLQDFLKSGANAVLLFLRALSLLPAYIRENNTAFALLTIALLLYTAAKIKATLADRENTSAKILNTVATKLDEAATWLATASKRAYATVVALVTREITIATAATRAWSFVVATFGGPLGIMVAALIAAAGAMLLFNRNTQQATTAQRKLTDEAQRSVDALTAEKVEMNETFEILKKGNISTETRKDLIDELNKKYKEYLPNLLNEKSTLQEIEVAQKAANAQLEKKMLLLAYNDEIVETGKQLAANRVALVKSEKEIAAINARSYAANSKIYGSATAALQKLADLSILKRNSAANIAQLKASVADIKSIYEQAFRDIGFNLDDVLKGPDKAPGTDLTGGADMEKAQQDKLDALRKEYEKFIEDIQALRRVQTAAAISADEEEIQKVKEKYIELESKARDLQSKFKDAGLPQFYDDKKLQADLANIEAIKQLELNNTYDSQFDRRTEKEYAASQNATVKYFEQQKLLEKKKYAEGLIDKQSYEEAINEIDSRSKHIQVTNFNDYYENRKDAYKGDKIKLQQLEDEKVALLNGAYSQDYENFIRAIQRKREAQSFQDNADIINATTAGDADGLRDAKLAKVQHDLDAELALNQISAEDTVELEELKQARINEAIAKAAQERAGILADYQAKEVAKVQLVIDGVLSISNSLADLGRQFDDIDIARDKKNNDKKKKALDDQLAHKRISQVNYNKAVEKLDKELAEKQAAIKKKQFIQDKAARVIASIMNTALGVTAALTSVPPNPFLAALNAGIGIAQTAIIAATPTPEFDAGTEAWRESIGGDRHSDTSGGNPILDGSTGKVLGRMQKGEAIIPDDTTEANRPIIRMLLRNRGKKLNFGRAVQNVQYANGGMFLSPDSWITAKPERKTVTDRLADSGTDNTGHFQVLIDQNAELIKGINRIAEKDFGSVSLTDIYKKETTLKFIRKNQL